MHRFARRTIERAAAARGWLARTFLRTPSVTLLHIASPTPDQLAALARVMDDMSNPRSSRDQRNDMPSAILTSESRT